jgi:hypothetical protein
LTLQGVEPASLVLMAVRRVETTNRLTLRPVEPASLVLLAVRRVETAS